jgi:hypothetical protein
LFKVVVELVELTTATLKEKLVQMLDADELVPHWRLLAVKLRQDLEVLSPNGSIGPRFGATV